MRYIIKNLVFKNRPQGKISREYFWHLDGVAARVTTIASNVELDKAFPGGHTRGMNWMWLPTLLIAFILFLAALKIACANLITFR